MKSEADIRSKLREYGLGRVENEVIGLRRPSVRLVTERTDDPMFEAVTRIGGDPVLPVGFAWPELDGRPLSFLGQVSLEQVARLGIHSALPPHGMLAFFLDMDGLSGTGPTPEGARVLYFVEALTARRTPSGTHRFHACRTRLVPAWSLPPGSADCPFTYPLHLTGDEQTAYDDFSSLADEYLAAPSGHRLLGYASGHDDDMHLGSEIDNSARRGELIDLAYPLGRPRERTGALDDLMAAARTWRPLMHFVYDAAAETGWWERGICFMIRETALSSGRLTDVYWRLA